VDEKFKRLSALVSQLEWNGFHIVGERIEDEVHALYVGLFAPDTTAPDERDPIDEIECAIWKWGGIQLDVFELADIKFDSAADLVRRLPGFPEDEDPEAWALKNAISAERVGRLADKFTTCGGDPILMRELGTDCFARSAKPVSFAIETLIPLQAITLLIGKRKSGKSTLLTEMAVAIARGDSEWAGFRLPEDPRVVLLFSGEDSAAVVADRLKYLGPDRRAGLIRTFDQSGNLKENLAKWEKARVSMVGIDPKGSVKSSPKIGRAHV